jgi:xylose dehydrogenase (NAD/NADP)
MPLDAFTDLDAHEPRALDTTIRFAVVGCGGFARNAALPALDAAHNCEPTVAVSGTDEHRETVCEAYDTVGLDYDAYAAGEASDAYDAVYVATPNRLHLPHAETAADLGKAVVSEKPLEATADRAERLVEACDDAGVLCATAYRMQADPLLRGLRDFLQQGGLGEVTKLSGDFTFDVLGGTRGPDQWRLDAHLAGGGALLDVGVYPLNTSRFLLDADPEWVDGHVRSSPPFDEVDEHVDVHVGFPDAVGSFSSSFSGHANAHLVVQGTEGRLRLEDAFQPDRGRTLVVERGDERTIIEGRGGGELRRLFDRVAVAVDGDGVVSFDGGDGLTDVRLMEAVYESAEGEGGGPPRGGR